MSLRPHYLPISLYEVVSVTSNRSNHFLASGAAQMVLRKQRPASEQLAETFRVVHLKGIRRLPSFSRSGAAFVSFWLFEPLDTSLPADAS
eukprot:764959-Heterocapsa_arctica.AAC.1